MKIWKVLACSMFAAAGMTAGCAVEPAADQEEIQSADEALTYASLKGTWTGVDGIIYSLDLTKDHASTMGGLKGYKFSATIDTGVRCIMAPCDAASTTVSGVYKVDGSKLTLASYDKPTATFAKILGDYKVASKDKVTKIKLTKSDGTLTENFTKDASGETCGNATCGAGLVCCNPVMGICTAPGMFCIM